MTVSRLLKSWATPPASRPTASIFWACRSCSSSRSRSVMSREAPVQSARPVPEQLAEGRVVVDQPPGRVADPHPLLGRLDERPVPLLAAPQGLLHLPPLGHVAGDDGVEPLAGRLGPGDGGLQ